MVKRRGPIPWVLRKLFVSDGKYVAIADRKLKSGQREVVSREGEYPADAIKALKERCQPLILPEE